MSQAEKCKRCEWEARGGRSSEPCICSAKLRCHSPQCAFEEGQEIADPVMIPEAWKAKPIRLVEDP